MDTVNSFCEKINNMISTTIVLLTIGLLTSIAEAVTVSCGDALQQTAVHCNCSNPGGIGVEWFVNGLFLTACFKPFPCSPNQTGYTFLTDSAADLYILTINSHSYSHCGVYECRDVVSSLNKDSFPLSISNTHLDMTWEPDEQIQPSNHTGGNFSVTSPCLFEVNTTEILWYTVSNGITEEYFPEENSTQYIGTSCQACNGVNATQIRTSFLHYETNPGDKTCREVSFAVKIYKMSISFPGVYCIFDIPFTVPPETSTGPPDSDCQCWITVIVCIVLSRLLFAQTWILGNSLYRRQKEIQYLNYLQRVEVTMIFLTVLPFIGLISCVWAYFNIEQDHKYPKWLKCALAFGLIVGCIQPGFGLFITGAAYATYVQNSCALFFSSVIFIMLVGTDVAHIIACTVLKLECYYYILISLGYIVVWIIAVVIMVKSVQKIYIKQASTTLQLKAKGNITTTEQKQREDSSTEDLTVDDCTCDLCGQLVCHTLKGFCLNQKLFLCNSCLSKHKCNGRHLKHNQHDEAGREKCFPCEGKRRKGHRNLPAHGYCLECMLYLCTECLIDHNEHELLWMPHHEAKTLDDICCFKTRTERNNTIPLGFCKTCKMYICEECISLHKGTHSEKPHVTVFHQRKETRTIPARCSECSNPRECYKLNVNKYLCADCYASDSLWTKNLTSDEETKTILKESKTCQLHNDVGDRHASYSPTDVYCIVCNLYLCKECFKIHRRFRERWIATHRDNLFTCKGCQEKNNVFPVECFCIKSKSFLCAVCFEEGKPTNKQATKNHLRSEIITRLSDNPNCELHKVPFQCTEAKESSTVYCLLCKTYMCDDCFAMHLRLKQVWTNHNKKMKFTSQKKFMNNEVSPIRM